MQNSKSQPSNAVIGMRVPVNILSKYGKYIIFMNKFTFWTVFSTKYLFSYYVWIKQEAKITDGALIFGKCLKA